jgi:hypothetical protein
MRQVASVRKMYLADVGVIATASSAEQILRVEFEILVHGARAALLATEIWLLQTSTGSARVAPKEEEEEEERQGQQAV